MYKIKIDNMNLKQIANSGQCFRWKEISKNQYAVVAFGRCLKMSQCGNEFSFDCTKEEWDEIWSEYFDMTTDYGDIGRIINESKDEHLIEAYNLGSGMRILKQDLWEIIVSFMISQNNNIKRISKSVELLCERGNKKAKGCEDFYAFPGPFDIDLEIFMDSSMGFGYRASNLKELFIYTRENPNWVDNLKEMTYDDAMAALMERKGIGKKVANCICLFGLHHVDAFPIDTHVRQLLDKYYKDGFDFEKYKGIAGIIQQYLFYYELLDK